MVWFLHGRCGKNQNLSLLSPIFDHASFRNALLFEFTQRSCSLDKKTIKSFVFHIPFSGKAKKDKMPTLFVFPTDTTNRLL